MWYVNQDKMREKDRKLLCISMSFWSHKIADVTDRIVDEA